MSTDNSPTGEANREQPAPSAGTDQISVDGIDGNPRRADEDPLVIEAFAEGRDATDIYVVCCPWCGWWTYYNQGSHCNCRKCDRDIIASTADAISMADYWSDAPYPCDDTVPTDASDGSQAASPEAK